jgi:hypothetical protein
MHSSYNFKYYFYIIYYFIYMYFNWILYLNHIWVFNLTTDDVDLNGRNAYGWLIDIVINGWQ